MSEAMLYAIIEQLREHLTYIAYHKNSFVDQDVLEISQRLDRYILKMQMLQEKKRMMVSE